ncbi:MAG: LUD domain-containing protein [Actinomyces bowdenii]|nr:LUD domain-containing protein [Actinomyces bowdenii]
MDAKTAILARARDAISRSQSEPVRPIPRDYVRQGSDPAGSQPVIEEMVDTLEDYSAHVALAPTRDEVLDAIDELLGPARIVVVPAGLPEDYKAAAARSGRELWEDSREEPIATLRLDEADAVLTCSRLGISISGTIVLDGEPDQGRRAISLVPDRHVVVLERASVVPTVPLAVDVMGQHPTRPMTWISGPSATSDIELVRVNGVHGPRNLGVIIAH